MANKVIKVNTMKKEEPLWIEERGKVHRSLKANKQYTYKPIPSPARKYEALSTAQNKLNPSHIVHMPENITLSQ